MPDFDTSSYPKAAPVASPSLLDVASKLGGMQQQKLSIDQAKLDQANQGFTYLTRAMGSLGPNATKDQYKAVGENAVKLGLVPPNMLSVWNERVDAAPDSPTFFNQTIAAVQDHQQQLEGYIGRPGVVDNGQTQTPVRTPAFTGAPIQTGMPVQNQTPPNTVVMDKNNRPTTVGAQPPQLAPGTVAVPTPLPAMRPAPAPPRLASLAAPPTTGPTGPSVETTGGPNSPPATVTQRIDAATPPQPAGFSAGTPPLFEEGKKALTEDQLVAAQKMTAVKPAILGLKLLPGLQTGPGTEAWNKAVGFLKAQGVIPIGKENDATVVYQEANKYFSQYLKGRGGRSDADLQAAEKSSPNVGSQLNPALQNLTRSAIAQDRIEAARPTAFQGADYSKYGQHRATFPQSIDERAFQLDLMPKAEAAKLVDQMHAKYQKNPKNPEAIKFFNSLDTAKKQGFFSSDQE